jgi:hypothetical protein
MLINNLRNVAPLIFNIAISVRFFACTFLGIPGAWFTVFVDLCVNNGFDTSFKNGNRFFI